MTRTGIFATPEEIEILKRPVPYMIIGGREPETAQQKAHRFAKAHGLPEITGYYGCDLQNGEFVSV